VLIPFVHQDDSVPARGVQLLDRTGNMFIVLPGHEDLLVEDVVDASNRYVVVRKRDLAARIVEQAQAR
jgi:hypothetical protein